MKTTLPNAIASVEEAKAFLKALHDNDEAFHPEDPAEEVISGRTGKRLFTDSEAMRVNAIMRQIYALPEAFKPDGEWSFDPCEFLLELDNGLKHFYLTDKTGRGYSTLVTDWHGFDSDDDEVDYNGVVLRDFIGTAEIDEVWENAEKSIKRVK